MVFNRPQGAEPVIAKTRNVIVEWEAPQVSIRKEVKYLGVIKANPVDYVQKYGRSFAHFELFTRLFNEIF